MQVSPARVFLLMPLTVRHDGAIGDLQTTDDAHLPAEHAALPILVLPATTPTRRV